YRNSFERPEPIKPNTVTPFTIDLHTADHVFKKGHRIIVQVQSTWFPLYDRNPQRFVPNIFEAKASDFQVATQRIYRSKRYPSSVEIMVLPQSAERAAN
ncbi:MAG: CocE/NonD family hydrolase C-terminal non-catalytic domain-containing protein, partial [Candidatus Acidiferrum sp.]